VRFFKAIADLDRYLAKSGRGEDMIIIAEDPPYSVVHGAGKALGHF